MDIDTIITNSNLDKEEQEEKQKKRKEKREKRSKRPLIITGIVTGLLSFGLGTAFGVSTSGDTSTDAGGNSKYVVDAMGDKVSLDEQVTGLQNAQLDAIRTQYSDFLESDTDGKASLALGTRKYAIASANVTAAKKFDPFFKEMMSVKKDADTDRAKIAVRNVKDFLAVDADKAAFEGKFQHNDIAHELGDGLKSGSVFTSIIGMTSTGDAAVLALIPYTTEQKTVNAVYLIKSTYDGMIKDYTYAGYIEGGSNGAKGVYEKLSTALKGSQQQISE